MADTVQVLATEPVDLRTAVPAGLFTDDKTQPLEGLVLKLTAPVPEPPLVVIVIDPFLGADVVPAALLIVNEAWSWVKKRIILGADSLYL